MAKTTTRSTELSTRTQIADKLLDVFKDVEQGYTDQRERADDTMDYWDLYNNKLTSRQFYDGNSQIALPLIHDAVEARKTRFSNQLFPQSQRYVEVTTENGDIPHALMALAEHYIRRQNLRTRVIRPLLVNGDVEGQYSIYVGWRETKRHVVSKVQSGVKVEGLEHADLGSVEDMDEEEILEAMPYAEVIPDSDLLILPQTVDTVDEALAAGGSVSIMRRWSKAKIKAMMASKDITKAAGESLMEAMSKGAEEKPNTAKRLADAAGIKAKGKFALVYETWTMLKVDDTLRLCIAYYAGEQNILGAKLCPYWCDKCPVISGPVEKVTGVFKGRAPIADVMDLQVLANDTINEAADTAHFSAMPIIMTDPEKNPRVGSMVLGLASVWETSPNDTKFAQFPELWRDGLARVNEIKAQIFQTLGINPSMMPQQTGGKNKRNQAEIANEQQVDLLTTADAVTVLEEQILTPMVERFIEYDHQFRDKATTVRVFGPMGQRAEMDQIEPIQMNRRFEFRWCGVESARNAAQMQQQIAGVNVIKGIPPQMYPDYDLDLSPLLVQMAENLFGPRLAPLIFKKKVLVSVDPMVENEMLEHGFDVPVNPADDDAMHIQEHMTIMQTSDPHGTVRAHIAKHQMQTQAKSMAAAQKQGGQPGSPGGAGPGAAGTPAGGQPGMPMGAKGPPGMIPQDQMAAAGAPGMPRKM